MRDEYIAYPDLDDKDFLEWLKTHFIKLRDLKASVLSEFIMTGSTPTHNEERVITESIMHVPLVYLYRRYLYEKAKPVADHIASTIDVGPH